MIKPLECDGLSTARVLYLFVTQLFDTIVLIDHNPLPSDEQLGRELAWRQPWSLL